MTTNTITIELGREEQRDAKGRLCQKPGNINPLVEPLGEAFRGLWRFANLPFEWQADRKHQDLPRELPGYHVEVDLKARRVLVFDPLYTSPEREAIERQFSAAFGKRFVAEPIVIQRCAPPQLWTWLKWMHRMVEAGDARLVSGEFPPAVAERVQQEREWDAAADPNSGARIWAPEPALAE